MADYDHSVYDDLPHETPHTMYEDKLRAGAAKMGWPWDKPRFTDRDGMLRVFLDGGYFLEVPRHG